MKVKQDLDYALLRIRMVEEAIAERYSEQKCVALCILALDKKQ